MRKQTLFPLLAAFIALPLPAQADPVINNGTFDTAGGIKPIHEPEGIVGGVWLGVIPWSDINVPDTKAEIDGTVTAGDFYNSSQAWNDIGGGKYVPQGNSLARLRNGRLLYVVKNETVPAGATYTMKFCAGHRLGSAWMTCA